MKTMVGAIGRGRPRGLRVRGGAAQRRPQRRAAARSRLGTSSRIDSLNPFVAFNQDAYSTFEYIYPSSIQYDKQPQLRPVLRKSWQASNGGKTWTFKTQTNAKWSDGKPLTAADAAWTINTDIKYARRRSRNAAGLVNHITNATAPNPTTLVVNYDQAPGTNVGTRAVQQFFIVPKHIWAQHTGNKGADLKTFPNNAPVVGVQPVHPGEVQEQCRDLPAQRLLLGHQAEDRGVRAATVLGRRRDGDRAEGERP